MAGTRTPRRQLLSAIDFNTFVFVKSGSTASISWVSGMYSEFVLSDIGSFSIADK